MFLWYTSQQRVARYDKLPWHLTSLKRVPTTRVTLKDKLQQRHVVFMIHIIGCVFNLRCIMCNRTNPSCSLNILTSCYLNIIKAMLRSWYAIWGYAFALRNEIRTDFWSWEIHYAKCVKNVSELRNIMWYALTCVNLTGLFSWVWSFCSRRFDTVRCIER